MHVAPTCAGFGGRVHEYNHYFILLSQWPLWEICMIVLVLILVLINLYSLHSVTMLNYLNSKVEK
jgi:hypothetical protein